MPHVPVRVGDNPPNHVVATDLALSPTPIRRSMTVVAVVEVWVLEKVWVDTEVQEHEPITTMLYVLSVT